MSESPRTSITVQGARHNNLKDIDVGFSGPLPSLPGQRLRKSSSRSIHCMRKVSDAMWNFSHLRAPIHGSNGPPDVDRVEGVLPAVAIDQKMPSSPLARP